MFFFVSWAMTQNSLVCLLRKLLVSRLSSRLSLGLALSASLACGGGGKAAPSPTPSSFVIQVSASPGGSVVPSGAVAVVQGQNQTFTITPAAGYQLASLWVDGVPGVAQASYTFTNVIAAQSLSARFTLSGTSGLDMATVKARLYASYRTGSYTGAAGWLSTQRANGSWNDVAYADQGTANWLAMAHLDRLTAMSVAYAASASGQYQSAALLEGIAQGLRYWYSLKLVNPNWWYNDIGPQMDLEVILILTGDALPLDVLEGGAALLLDPSLVGATYATGQNLLDLDGEQLVRGILNQSLVDLNTAVVSIGGAIQTTTAEGIQPDGSFHQHGAMFQSGSYGLDFLQVTSFWASMLAGTSFALPDATAGVLSACVLQGARSMVRARMFDYGAQCRAMTRQGASTQADGLLEVCDSMAQVDPANAAQYAALNAHIQGTGLGYSWIGNRHFWNSDFMSHQRAGFYTSVKMFSSRTLGTEVLNGENLQGYWTPFGTTLLCQRGDEYKAIFPVWDWSRLPGVTCPHALGTYVAPFSQTASFVGGVSDGTYGAAVMAVDKDGTKACKSWFFFDNEWVALGSGITSTQAAAVGTTINQCVLNGPVLVNGNTAGGPGPQAYAAVSWVLHDGIGYVFPQPAALMVGNGPQTGSWQSINAQYPLASVTSNVFLLYLNHGSNPASATYEYIVVPGATAAGIAAYATAPPVVVLSNTSTLQAVRQTALGITGIAFYGAGSLTLPSGKVLAVDQPCLVLVKENAVPPTAVVSNPNGTAITLSLTVTPSGGSGQTLVYNLPGAGQGGVSVALPLP